MTYDITTLAIDSDEAGDARSHQMANFLALCRTTLKGPRLLYRYSWNGMPVRREMSKLSVHVNARLLRTVL